MINTDGEPATGELPGQARQPDRLTSVRLHQRPKGPHTGGQIGSPAAQRYPSQPRSPSVRRAGEEFKVPVRPAIEGRTDLGASLATRPPLAQLTQNSLPSGSAVIRMATFDRVCVR
jgi:hypothetical protein